MRKPATPSAEGLAAANARLRQTLQTDILAQAAKQIQLLHTSAAGAFADGE